MKQQSIYIANDGTRFDDEGRCLKYESQCLAISDSLTLLSPIPKDDGCSFANGGGYVQQDKVAVMNAYSCLLHIAEEIVGRDVVAKTRAAGEFLPKSIIGRYIDDSGHRALYSAWGRLMNLDSQWREWGQGYYSLHPEEGEQVDLSVN